MFTNCTIWFYWYGSLIFVNLISGSWCSYLLFSWACSLLLYLFLHYFIFYIKQSVLYHFKSCYRVSDCVLIRICFQETFADYTASTAFERPLLNGVAYAQRVVHAERQLFENQQGWMIKTMKRDPSPVQDEYAPVIYSQETVSYIEALDMMSGEVVHCNQICLVSCLISSLLFLAAMNIFLLTVGRSWKYLKG